MLRRWPRVAPHSRSPGRCSSGSAAVPRSRSRVFACPRPIRFVHWSLRRCWPRFTCSHRDASESARMRRSRADSQRRARGSAAVLAVAIGVIAIAQSSYTASGADAYAYVTQADLLLAGTAHRAGSDRQRGAMARGRCPRSSRLATPPWRTSPRSRRQSDRVCRCSWRCSKRSAATRRSFSSCRSRPRCWCGPRLPSDERSGPHRSGSARPGSRRRARRF